MYLVFHGSFGDEVVMQPPYGCPLEHAVKIPSRLRGGDKHERSLHMESNGPYVTHR